MVEQATTRTRTGAATVSGRSTFGRCPGCATAAELHAVHQGLCAYCWHHRSS